MSMQVYRDSLNPQMSNGAPILSLNLAIGGRFPAE